ncbi:transposase [Floccifex sp.]
MTFTKPLFWTNSYFLGSVGSHTTEIVKEYIQNQ